MMTKAFIRRVGFGLRPDEVIPEDPLNWAKSQMNMSPKLIWFRLSLNEETLIFESVDLSSINVPPLKSIPKFNPLNTKNNREITTREIESMLKWL